MSIWFKFFLIIVASASFAGALALGTSPPAHGYTLADAVMDVAWRQATAARLWKAASIEAPVARGGCDEK